MKIGYARVSTLDQDLSLQLDALEKAECEKIYQEKMTGTGRERPHLLRSSEIYLFEGLCKKPQNQRDILCSSCLPLFPILSVHQQTL